MYLRCDHIREAEISRGRTKRLQCPAEFIGSGSARDDLIAADEAGWENTKERTRCPEHSRRRKRRG